MNEIENTNKKQSLGYSVGADANLFFLRLFLMLNSISQNRAKKQCLGKLSGLSSNVSLTFSGWVDTVIQEIDAGADKDSIAISYAMAISMNISQEDASKLNAHIIKHWGKNTLSYIKEKAWNLYLERYKK